MHRDIHILIVEDNPGDALLIREMIHSSSFGSATMLMAASLGEAIQHGKGNEEIPLILLDLGLPDSNGMETVRSIRKYFPESALNILTGFDDKQTATDALREGVQNYLVKGEIDSDELEEAIRYSLERHNFINKLKEANESLKLSERKYKLLFRDNPMPMWVIDYKNNLSFVDVNEAALQHYGYTREEFLSMTSVDIRPEDDKGRYIELHRASNSGSNYAGIWKHIKKDRTIIDVEIITHDVIIENREVRLVLANDVTERLKTENALIESQDTLRELAAHLQTVREEERAHLAREVHDLLGQQITSLKMDMTWLNKKIAAKDKNIEDRFTEMLSLADEMVKTVRKISSELRPGILDDLGLVPALEWQSSEFEKRTGIKCYFTSDNTLPDLNKINAIGIFRIYQETLTNVARHAEATEVDATIICDKETLRLTIVDNGKGLNPEILKSKKTLGITGMKERATMMEGNLTIQTRSEGGTVVTLSVPLEAKMNASA